MMCASIFSMNLKVLLVVFSNLCTALMVYLVVYLSLQPGNHAPLTEIVERQLLIDLKQSDHTPCAPVATYNITTNTSIPPPSASQQAPPPLSTLIVYYFFSRTEGLPLDSTRDDILCKLHSNATPTLEGGARANSSMSGVQVSGSKHAPSFKSEHDSSHLKGVSQSGKTNGSHAPTEFLPYVIGITPTYYRMTQKLDLTSLCQTLMNVPRLLWIVVEDASNTTSQVKEILSRCQVESVLLHAKTTAETKKANQRGVDQRNLAIDWIRNNCAKCNGRGTCEGVVYFMDDDNTFDIRLFEQMRWTRGVSVFPVGFVAGLKFEGPVCKDGKVEKWQVQYAPKRHIPVDMAAFALNVNLLTAHPKVKMGFKPGSSKRSTPGYLEPDFLKSLGAKRDTVECRGSNDEILVWHVKSTYRSLVYEKKHPSDPKFKV